MGGLRNLRLPGTEYKFLFLGYLAASQSKCPSGYNHVLHVNTLESKECRK